MTDAKRDQNNTPTALVWDGTSTKPLLVDTATGRLLIHVTPVLTTNQVEIENAARDENHVTTAMAYNNTEDRNLLIDNRNGLLWADVFDEGGVSPLQGNPMGLLLAITYPVDQ